MVYGVPQRRSPTDVDRVMSHYGVSRDEAVKGMAEGKYPLPPRGTDIEYASVNNPVNWVLVATGIGAVISGLAMIYVGTRGS